MNVYTWHRSQLGGSLMLVKVVSLDTKQDSIHNRIGIITIYIYIPVYIYIYIYIYIII